MLRPSARDRAPAMSTHAFALAATIILTLPMLYFLLASPTFLLRPLSDPVVAWLLRGLFGVHFLLVGVTCGIAAAAFAFAGLPAIALAIAATAALAFAARRWFLRRMDVELRACDAGDAAAPRRLRRLHWGGMAYNAIQFAAVIASMPQVFPSAA